MLTECLVKRATKIVEWIKERWTGREKSKKMMISKLVEKELMDSAVSIDLYIFLFGCYDVHKLCGALSTYPVMLKMNNME